MDKNGLMKQLTLKDGKVYIQTWAGMVKVSRVFLSLDSGQNVFDANRYMRAKRCKEGLIYSGSNDQVLVIAGMNERCMPQIKHFFQDTLKIKTMNPIFQSSELQQV